MQMTGENRQIPVWIECRAEKRKSVDVIPVCMGQHQGRKFDVLTDKFDAQITYTGTGVEYQMPATTNHLDATGVAAIDDMTCRRTCDAAPNSPELHFEAHTLIPAIPVAPGLIRAIL